MDLLHDHLLRARASGAVFARTVARPPWGLTLPGSIQLSLHAVVRGEAWLWQQDLSQAMRLLPGELALMVGGCEHHYASAASPALCEPHADFMARPAGDEDDAEATVFLCGAYALASDVGRRLLQALPSMLILRPAPDAQINHVVGLIAEELRQVAPGQQTVLDRLLDVLLVLAMRLSFEQGPSAPRWFQAASDPRLARALQAMHDQPASPWTVSALAGLSAMSRPAFARRFQQALGQAPLQYLTDWRMTLARDYLRGGELTQEQIAERIGYGSVTAFAATFRRHVGVSPGRWRQPSSMEDEAVG